MYFMSVFTWLLGHSHFTHEFYSKNSKFSLAAFLHIIFTISFTTTPHYKWRWFNTHSTKKQCLLRFHLSSFNSLFTYRRKNIANPFCASPYTYTHTHSVLITIIFINLPNIHVCLLLVMFKILHKIDFTRDTSILCINKRKSSGGSWMAEACFNILIMSMSMSSAKCNCYTVSLFYDELYTDTYTDIWSKCDTDIIHCLNYALVSGSYRVLWHVFVCMYIKIGDTIIKVVCIWNAYLIL